VRCQVNWGRGRVAECAAAAEQAVLHARVAGDEVEESANLAELASIWLFGPTPVREGIRNCEEILASPALRPSLEGRVLRALGALRALDGDVDEGRALIERSREIFEDLGWKFYVAGALQLLGVVEMMAGEPAAAEAALRTCYEILREAGDRSYMSTGAAGLAAALAELGRDDDAEALARISADAAAESDVDSQMGWRIVMAGILVRRGEPAEAVRLAREAAELTASTDLIMITDIRLEVAKLLATAGEVAEAEGHARAALDGYLAKGNRMGEARARGVLARLTPAPA
jgi:ATP/maltotriose-dependent transcriptional regulator MalT